MTEIEKIVQLRRMLRQYITIANIGVREKWTQGDGTPAISSLWLELNKETAQVLEETNR